MQDASKTLSHLFGLDGKVALIVGGGRGMGEASARHLASVGCDIVILDLHEVHANRVAEDIRKMGRRATVVIGDALDIDQIEGLVQRARQEMGRLDVLVTIVGAGIFQPSIEMTPENWDFDHNRNLRYVFFFAQQFARTVVKDGNAGSIVCIASMSAVVAAVSNAAYGAAKAGVISVVKTLATEWAVHRIRVNVVLPGSIITPDWPDSEQETKAIDHIVPLKRRGTTDEIGRAVLFLASDLSRYTTGHALAVEGGWLAASSYRMPAAD